MTFYPEFGPRSIETFDSTGGSIATNPTLQNIAGGHVTLLSTQTGTSYIIRNWKEVSNWTFTDNLYNRDSISGSFNIYTGTAVPNHVATQSGMQGTQPNAAAWYVFTDYPIYYSTHSAYSGQTQQGLYLGENSPYTGYTESIDNGASQFTIEFDISSTLAYSGLSGLAGFSTTQSNLSGLASLTGIVNHGVLIQTINKWDFIECTPYGIRSFNHPDLSLPIDLLTPKRVRIGVRDSDLFLATEDGKAIYALGMFDTVHSAAPARPFIYFGAPFTGTYGSDQADMTGVDGFYGYTVWDNIKLLTGELAIYSNSGIERIYTTGITSFYSAPFDPDIAISSYNYATIRYVPYHGGTTTVYSQYSGAAGWTTHNSVTLSSSGNYTALDLTSIPIYNYPRTNLGLDYTNNPLRFRIDQNSTDGSALPPAIESIEVTANSESYKIDLLPDWKPYNRKVEVQVGIVTGRFNIQDPVPEAWTSFLLNTPGSTGQITTGIAFYDESKYAHAVHALGGSGEIVPGGPYGYCYKNYLISQASGLTGSAAADVFGPNPVSNLFPNPIFSEGFRAIGTGEERYQTGLTEGYLAAYVEIAQTYTGGFKVDFAQTEVYRPLAQASLNRINNYIGGTLSAEDNYVQGVYVYPTANTHDGTVGIEAFVPSGIASGDLLVSFDIEISKGSGINVFVTGSSKQEFLIPGEFARSFIPVSVYTTSTNANELRIGFNVPSGYPGDEYEYNIDNLTVSPVTRSYLKLNNLSGYRHLTGTPNDSNSASAKVGNKASTVVYGNLFLDSYPIANSGVFIRALGTNGRGFELNIDSNGYLHALVDHESNSWSDDLASFPFYETLPSYSLVSAYKVPVGQWTSIGLIHDVHNFDKLGYASYSGDSGFPANFASTNRLTLTIDGYPVCSKDLMSGWQAHTSNAGFDAAPYASYINLTGSVTATIASGLTCKVDAIHLIRPPVADAETNLSIKGARVCPPYFVADSLYKANVPSGLSNLLYNDNNSTLISKDIFIGSCYNFSGPGYLNWDHGQLHNHLIFNGTVEKVDSNPYTGQNLNSIRFHTGAYGVASYSSSFERTFNVLGQMGIEESNGTVVGLNHGKFVTHGWIYPYSTGKFFALIEDKKYLTGNRFELEVNAEEKIVFNKYNSTSDVVVFSITGHSTPLNEWSYFNLGYTMSTGSYHTAKGSSSVITAYLAGETLTGYTTYLVTGVDYGIQYRGRLGSTGESEIRFGNGADIGMFNWVLYNPSLYNTGYTSKGSIPYYTTGNKGGRYQAIIDGSSLITGNVHWDDYYRGRIILEEAETGTSRFISVAALNSYDQMPRLNGITISDDKPFREVTTYNILYNSSRIEQVFGATDSPIRIGNQVPNNAINIAKFSSESYTVPGAINTLDLSDSNVNNLITYKRGNYFINKNNIASSAVTGYENINKHLYSGRIDVTYSGQVISSDVNISTLTIVDKEQSEGYEGYYYYLIGRGEKVLKILDAYPHATGQITEYSTGNTDNYIANIEKIKSSIKIKNRKGSDITDQIPYDVVTSPYTPSSLLGFINSGYNVSLDNIGSQLTGSMLANGLFSVVLLTNTNKYNNQDSMFVHYNAYDLENDMDLPGYKEIINPQLIFRERYETEAPGIGKFDLTLNTNNFYDLKLYCVASGYSGVI